MDGQPPSLGYLWLKEVLARSRSNRSTTTTSGRSYIGTEGYPNFHGNTCLAQTQSYFDLSGNSLIVHFLDVEMDSANWNLRGHSVDVLYPTGL